MGKKVTLGLIQMHCTEKREENLEKALNAIRDVASKGAQIVCLPELFLGPYFCQQHDDKYFAMAEPVPGEATEIFSKLAKEKKIVIMLSIYELASDGLRYNTVVVIDADGTLLGKYRKMHVPNDPEHGYDETYYFAPGDLGFQVFETKYAKVSPMICYDQWFPEGARMCALKGAEILFYPTAIGWPEVVRKAVRSGGASEDGSAAESAAADEAEISEKISAEESAVPIGKADRPNKEYFDSAENDAWQVTQRSHAIDNHVFVAAVNRTQQEQGLNFWGTSFVCDPYGVVLGKASADKEENLVVECDLGLIDLKRADWPFLKERRIKVEG